MSLFNDSILWDAVLQSENPAHHFFFLSFEVNTLKKIGASVTWHMLKYINIGGLEKQVLFMLCLKTWNKFRFWNKSRPEFRSDKTEKT